MIETYGDKQLSAFSWWLRTGKLPPALSPDGLELKFNPWRDPEDGRFTFAGAGRHHGASGTDAVSSEKRRTPTSSDRAPVLWDRSESKDFDIAKGGNVTCGNGGGRGPAAGEACVAQSTTQAR